MDGSDEMMEAKLRGWGGSDGVWGLGLGGLGLVWLREGLCLLVVLVMKG